MPLEMPPEPVRILIPEKCKPFIVRQRRRNILMVFLPNLFVIPFLILGGLKATRIEIGHLVPIPFACLVWFYIARKHWRYQIDKNGIHCLIEQSSSSWSETEVLWKDCIILSATETTWQDLPALTFKVGAKIDSSITYVSVVQMPYRPEDVHLVRDRAVPAIQYHRAKHGHDKWIADHGWQGYTKPSELLADG